MPVNFMVIVVRLQLLIKYTGCFEWMNYINVIEFSLNAGIYGKSILNFVNSINLFHISTICH